MRRGLNESPFRPVRLVETLLLDRMRSDQNGLQMDWDNSF